MDQKKNKNHCKRGGKKKEQNQNISMLQIKKERRKNK
jgi:hypothetical protein